MTPEKTNLKMVLNRDIFLGFFLFIFFVWLWSESHKIISLTVSDVGGDFFPKIVSGFGLILSVFIFLGGIQAVRREKSARRIKTSPDVVADKANKKNNIMVSVVSLGLIFLYMIFFRLLGFILASSLYVLVQAFILTPDEKKRSKKTMTVVLCVAGIVPALVFIFFRYFFTLMLPVGLFFY